MTALMPNPDLVPRVPLAETEVPNLRAVPLPQLANLAEAILRRIIPQEGAVKAPVAAFDASL